MSSTTTTAQEVRLEVRLPRALADAVRELARAEGEAMGVLVRRALRRLVADAEEAGEITVAEVPGGPAA